MSSYVIRGAKLLGNEPTDIAFEHGVITAIAAGATGDVEIDANGLVALPGLVDLHTHVREPGREDAETVLTGSRAAARGGFTCVHAMANTEPVPDTAGVADHVRSVIVEQVTNGVAVRMAVLYLLLGGAAVETDASEEGNA